MTIYLTSYLEQHFNYNTFNEGQREIIDDVLNGHNVFGVLPTGSGKSLCYQLPAKLLNGTTIVISPLISLMLDQVKQLKAIQYKDVVALNSFISWQERQTILRQLANYSLVYVSPELLQDEHVLKWFMNIKVSLFVIDEAHCVSQWGHEFRTDYLRLPNIIKKLGSPTVLALSATAPQSIQDETIKLLNLTHVRKHIYPIDRENIALVIKNVLNEQEKLEQLVELLRNYRVPTLIYFLSRNKCEEIATFLSNTLTDKRVAYYHGHLDSVDRITIQQQFMNDEIDIICCTSAFGMGVNKRNIRLIVHYHLPIEVESFIQEIGRAGRDGKQSVSVLFYTENDHYYSLNMIEHQLPLDDDVKQFFRILYDQYKLHNQLPNDEDELVELFQLQMPHIRFLLYQLEKHQLITQNKIYYNQSQWKNAYEEIIQFKDERLTYKQKNLQTILNWIESTHCLRKSIYSLFQTTYTVLDDQCCSNCNFSFEKWAPKQTERKYINGLTWEEKLADLLLVGDSDETSRHY